MPFCHIKFYLCSLADEKIRILAVFSCKMSLRGKVNYLIAALKLSPKYFKVHKGENLEVFLVVAFVLSLQSFKVHNRGNLEVSLVTAFILSF